MKFPVLFRILAAFILLSSIFYSLIITGLLTMNVGLYHFGAFPLMLLILITGWMLFTSFSWFFASRVSYPLLLLNSLGCLTLASIFLYLAWLAPDANRNDAFPITVMAFIPLIYFLFSLIGLFYKPVRAWKNSVAPGNIFKTHPVLFSFAGSTLLLALCTAWYLKVHRDHEVEVATVYDYLTNEQGSPVYMGSFPAPIPFNGNIAIPLTDTAEIDAIKIPVEAGANIHPWKKANLISYGFTPIPLTFTKEGEFYIAHFARIRTTGITIHPTDTSDTTAYMVSSISLVNHFSSFDKQSATDHQVAVNRETIEAESDEGYSPSLGSEQVPAVLAATLTNMLNTGASYYFNSDNEEALNVNGTMVGTYLAGIQNAMNFLNESLCQQIGAEGYCFDAAINQALFSTTPENSTGFRHVNPAAITWISDNLMPGPDAEVLGYKTSDWYNASFKNMARGLARAHQHLEYSEAISDEAAKYSNAMNQPNFEAVQWLNEQYGEVLADMGGTPNISTTPIFIGFWLRRNIDGSESEIWNALKKMMTQYDADWVTQNINQ